MSDDFQNYKSCFKEYELENILFFIDFFKNLKCENEEETNEKNLIMEKLFISLIGIDNNNNDNINNKFIDFIQYLSNDLDNNNELHKKMDDFNNIYKSNLFSTIDHQLISIKSSILNNDIYTNKRNNNEDNLIFQKNHSKKPWIKEEDC